MKGGSDIVSAIHNLKIADEHFQSFKRTHPGSRGAILFEGYSKRINWIFKDILSNPLLPQVVRDGIKQEIDSDVFAIPALHEKIPLLPPEQREHIELLIDEILSGKQLNIVNNEVETE